MECRHEVTIDGPSTCSALLALKTYVRFVSDIQNLQNGEIKCG